MSTVLKLVSQEKVCKVCEHSKPVVEFHQYSPGKPSGKCKPCHVSDSRKTAKAHWANNPEYRDRHNQAGKNYRKGIRTVKVPAYVSGAEKVCKVCGETKPMDGFPKRGNHRLNSCSVCYNTEQAQKSRGRYREDSEYRNRVAAKSRRSALKHMYGITPELADSMLANQHGLCANVGCGKEISFYAPVGSGSLAVIDHNHQTGHVRGILCCSCNIALGHLEKDAKVVLGLMDYKAKHDSLPKGE